MKKIQKNISKGMGLFDLRRKELSETRSLYKKYKMNTDKPDFIPLHLRNSFFAARYKRVKQ